MDDRTRAATASRRRMPLTAEELVRMVLSCDAMHDEQWTERAVMGWEMELGKLARVLGS